MIRCRHDSWVPSLSKPRASGDDPTVRLADGSYEKVNPARAGMIPGRSRRGCGTRRKPRASGDDPPAPAEDVEDAV